jgi:hypothetical protein
LLTDALRRDLSRPSFVGSSPGGGQPRLGRDTERDPVEPARHRALPTDRAGPLGEDQEDDLERILSVVRVAQHLLADAQDHWSVSLDQGRECRLLAPARESLEQGRVAQGADGARVEKCPEASEHASRLIAYHRVMLLQPIAR